VAEAIKNVLRYLKSRCNDGLAYAARTDSWPLIEGSSDSDYAQDKDTRRSVAGASHAVNGARVHWVSSRQRTVTLSSSEAEYTAVSRVARDITWLTALARDMCIPLANDGAALRADDKSRRRCDHADAPVSMLCRVMYRQRCLLPLMAGRGIWRSVFAPFCNVLREVT
jgi:hypothetical protein